MLAFHRIVAIVANPGLTFQHLPGSICLSSVYLSHDHLVPRSSSKREHQPELHIVDCLHKIIGQPESRIEHPSFSNLEESGATTVGSRIRLEEPEVKVGNKTTHFVECKVTKQRCPFAQNFVLIPYLKLLLYCLTDAGTWHNLFHMDFCQSLFLICPVAPLS